MRTRLVIKLLVVSSFILVIAIYASLKFEDYLKGPLVEIYEPNSGVIATSTVFIKGRAERISFLYLNDSPLFVDTNGHFNRRVTLFEGYNHLRIKARDKFEREIVKDVELLVTLNKENKP